MPALGSGIALATSCSAGCWPTCTGAKTSCCCAYSTPSDVPLRNQRLENDIRACVTKRKVSGGTMSTAGAQRATPCFGLMKTCRKPGVSFFRYLGDRLRVPGAAAVPPWLTSSDRRQPRPDRLAICPVTASRDLNLASPVYVYHRSPLMRCGLCCLAGPKCLSLHQAELFARAWWVQGH